MKAVVPKQFLEVDGETILEHTMQAFEHHALIHDIYVVAAPEWLDKVRALASRSVITKLRDVIQGGVTGFDSCTNGIRHLLASYNNVTAAADEGMNDIACEIYKNAKD